MPDRQTIHRTSFIAWNEPDEKWSDVLPNRQVEQEILDILDAE